MITTILIHSQFGKNSFNSSKAPSSTSMGPGRKGGKVGDIRSNLSSRNGGHGLDSLDSEQANGGLSLSASKNSWMMTPKVKFINDVTSNKFSKYFHQFCNNESTNSFNEKYVVISINSTDK